MTVGTPTSSRRCSHPSRGSAVSMPVASASPEAVRIQVRLGPSCTCEARQGSLHVLLASVNVRLVSFYFLARGCVCGLVSVVFLILLVMLCHFLSMSSWCLSFCPSQSPHYLHVVLPLCGVPLFSLMSYCCFDFLLLLWSLAWVLA